MIEGKVPPPFGLITPDALSPCLFTLLQQLGQEGVNEASSPSTAWIKTSTRKLRSLSGPCLTSLCATMQTQTGGLDWYQNTHKAPECNSPEASLGGHLIDLAIQHRNKQSGAIKAKVIRLLVKKGGVKNLLVVQECTVYIITQALIFADS